MRTMLAAVLFGLSAALVALSYFALRNLWSEYQDSPDSVYIEVAAIEWGIALIAALGGVLLLRHR